MYEPKKQCIDCRRWLYEGDFPVVYRRGRPYLRGNCDACYNAAKRRYRDEDKERYDGHGTAWRTRARHKSIVCNIRSRARAKGFAFDLDDHIDAIGERMYGGCELTGLPFDFGVNGKIMWNSPSIDRIKPALGYVYSNIRIICHGLNTAIGDWGEEQTAILMQAWLDKRNVT